jgi:hypothetical protein
MIEGKVVNEGLAMAAETSRQYGQSRKAELYEVLARCDRDDVCTLYDSSVFNWISQMYLCEALQELIRTGNLTVEQSIDISNRFRILHDETSAKQLLKRLNQKREDVQYVLETLKSLNEEDRLKLLEQL